MKLQITSVVFFLASQATNAEVLGCGNVPSDPNKVWIYSGPYSIATEPNRYLPGTYQFKAKENASISNRGHNAYWSLHKANTYNSPPSSFTMVEGVYNSSFNVITSKSDRHMTAPDSGFYCAVIVSPHFNSCNNRCFIVQERPTATGKIQDLPSGYTEVHTPIQFSGNGTIDKNAKQQSLSYTWDFDNGQTSSNRNPFYSFDKAGTYFVRLKTFDGTYESTRILVKSLWVRGPAEPPRTTSYSYSYCSHEGRIGDFSWERSGYQFELQISQSGYWIDLYRGQASSISLTLSSYGYQTFRIRALDPEYGPASNWKAFNANIPSCSGGEGIDPI